MTPVEELRAAAAKLRQMAANASPGPWSAGSEADGTFYHRYGERGWLVTGPAGSPEMEDSETGKADASWIALMGPKAAGPIAALLEHYAESVAWSDNWDDIRNCGVPIKRFARSILGEAS